MNRSHRQHGFSLIELVVVIAIVTVFASMLLPALSRARERSRGAQCLSNLRQWNLALSMYLHDYDDSIPRRGQGIQPLHDIDRLEDWFNALPPMLGLQTYQMMVINHTIPRPGETSVYVCPTARATTNDYFLSYAMNFYLSPTLRPRPHRLPEISRPSTLAFLADGGCAYSSTVPSSRAYSVQARHAQRANVAFLDGHAESFAGDYLGCGTKAKEQPDVRWQTETEGINHAPIP